MSPVLVSQSHVSVDHFAYVSLLVYRASRAPMLKKQPLEIAVHIVVSLFAACSCFVFGSMGTIATSSSPSVFPWIDARTVFVVIAGVYAVYLPP